MKLINELAERGITLTADGDDLIAWPTSAITPEVAETIRSNKPELLSALLLTDEGMSEELAREETRSARVTEGNGPTVGLLTELVDNRDNEDPELEYIKRYKAAEELLASLSWRAGMTFQLGGDGVRYWPVEAL